MFIKFVINHQLDSRQYEVGQVINVNKQIGDALVAQGVAMEPATVVTGSRTLTPADLESVLDVVAAATITIPSDAVLGISADWRGTFATLQTTAGAAAVTNGAGVNPLEGTAQTAAQYVLQGYMHIGGNLWKYV